MAGKIRAELFGRDAELATIDSVVEVVAKGRRLVALVQGEPGIGKSSLLDEFVRRAAERKFETVTAFADPLGARRPFGLLTRVLALREASPDPDRAELARMLLDRADFADPIAGAFAQGPMSLYRITEAALGLVERLGATGPILIGIDDLQWSDPATLVAVGEIAQRITDLPLLLVLTMRPLPCSSELSQLLDTLDRLEPVHLRLGPLSPGAVTEFAQANLGARIGKSLSEELAKAGGNPFFIEELLHALGADDRLLKSPDEVDVSVAAIAPDLQLTLLRRLSYLNADTLQLLRGASVLGSRFDAHDVAALIESRPLATDALVSEAITAGILRKDASGELTFAHDLIREAIYQDIPPGLSQALHVEAARLLRERGASASEMAPHLLAGVRSTDAAAARTLIEAGRSAIQSSPAIAIQLLERALGILPEGSDLAGPASAELATSLHWTGRLDEAFTVASRALAAGTRLQPDTAGLLHVAQMRSLFAQGQTQESLDIGTHVLQQEWPDHVRAMLLVETSLNQSYIGTLQEARHSAEWALELLKDDDITIIRSLALCSLASIEVLEGHLAKGIAYAEEVLASVSPEAPVEALNAHAILGVSLISADRPDRARRLVEEGIQIIERIGGSWDLQIHEWAVALIDFETGRWDDAIARIEAGFACARAGFGNVLASSLMALIALHRGDFESAAMDVSEGQRESAEKGGSFRADWLLWANALLLEAQGDEDQAQAVLAAAWDQCVSMGVISECVTLGPDLARLTMKVGDTTRANEVVEVTRETAARMESESAHAAALRCRATVTRDQDAALEAVALLRPLGFPFVLARSLEEAASLGADDLGRTKVLLDEALDLYERIGATGRAREVERALPTRGNRKRSAAARPTAGWESLTPSELAVVELVAQGFTNRECAGHLFVSHRTVETHLKHVFEKLDLHSRVQIAAAVARRLGDAGTGP